MKKIKSGEVTSALRKWKRPTVKQGGTLITRVGQLSIDKLEKISLGDVDHHILKACGIEDLESWKKKFYDKREGDLYLIRFSIKGPDPRIGLRENTNWSKDELIKIKKKLLTWDKNSGAPWTLKVMNYILKYPQRRAADMALQLNIEKDILKPNIRKLKAQGLTISHSIGYELSPRGKALLQKLKN
ncbi:MAG: ASCH domain-containing protein [Saprospiraceae bacterium]|nr:ASCH domain-containing protein [Saprospiraceae bacterium]